MKNNIKITAAIVAMLFGAGIGYTNLEDSLPEHPIKEYRFRSLERDLYVTFHHSATSGQSLNEIATYHVEKKGWPGVAYHFAINWEGEVFQLQKLEEITYHSKGHNTESIGIVFVGNFQEKQLPDKAVESAECLLAALNESLNIIGVRPHRQVRATLCPGDFADNKLKYLYR